MPTGRRGALTAVLLVVALAVVAVGAVVLVVGRPAGVDATASATSAVSPSAVSPSAVSPSAVSPSAVTASPTPAASLAPAAVLAAAEAAVARHSSVHVAGTGTSDGAPLTIDLRLVRDRGGSAVLHQPGVTVEIVRIGSDLWVRADEAFWSRNVTAAQARRIGTRWAHSTVTGPGAYGGFTDYSGFLASLLTASGELRAVPPTTVDGVPVVGVRDGGGRGGTLWVRAVGDPLPVRVEADGRLDLGDWDAPVTLAPPPASDVVDLPA